MRAQNTAGAAPNFTARVFNGLKNIGAAYPAPMHFLQATIW
jgi:hypothetical protein